MVEERGPIVLNVDQAQGKLFSAKYISLPEPGAPSALPAEAGVR
jgi:hypothetical protein